MSPPNCISDPSSFTYLHFFGKITIVSCLGRFIGFLSVFPAFFLQTLHWTEKSCLKTKVCYSQLKWFLIIRRKKLKLLPRTYKSLYDLAHFADFISWNSLTHSLSSEHGIFWQFPEQTCQVLPNSKSLHLYFALFSCHLAFLSLSILHVSAEISSHPGGHPPCYPVSQNHSISFTALKYSIFIWVIFLNYFCFLH